MCIRDRRHPGRQCHLCRGSAARIRHRRASHHPDHHFHACSLPRVSFDESDSIGHGHLGPHGQLLFNHAHHLHRLRQDGVAADCGELLPSCPAKWQSGLRRGSHRDAESRGNPLEPDHYLSDDWKPDSRSECDSIRHSQLRAEDVYKRQGLPSTAAAASTSPIQEILPFSRRRFRLEVIRKAASAADWKSRKALPWMPSATSTSPMPD